MNNREEAQEKLGDQIVKFPNETKRLLAKEGYHFYELSSKSRR